MQPTAVLLEEDLPSKAGDIADVCASISVVVRLPRPVADAVSREDQRRRLVIRQVVVMVLSGFVSQSALIPYRRGWHSQAAIDFE